MGRVKVTDPYSGATITVRDDSPQAKLWGESSRRITAEPIVEQEAPEVPAEVPEVKELEPPRGNASLEEWAEYALSKGVAGEDLNGLKQSEIRALFADK